MAKKDIKTQNTWQDKINRAKKKREEWETQFHVKLAREYFEGKQNPGYPVEEWITINKIYSHLQAQLPSLYSIDPYFYVKTKKSYQPDPTKIAEFDQRGKIRQDYLNYLKGELELKQKARLCIQDAHFAYGVAKVHFKSDQKKNPDYGSAIKSDSGEDMTDNGQPVMEPQYIPINERYIVTRCHPDDFLWDEDAGTLPDKWTWIAERTRLTKEEAEDDPRFTTAFLKNVKPQSRKNDSLPPISGEKESEDRSVYILWEIYNLKNKQWMCLVEDAQEILQDWEDLPPGVEQHCYAILRFTLRDNSPYPIPPISQAIDPQKEYCLARSRILTHRKRFNRKYEVVVERLADESEVSKLENGDDGTIIKVIQLGAVAPIQDAQLDNQGYSELALLNNDIVEVLGSGDEARGIASADSATQADIIDRRMEVREGDRLSIVTDFIIDIARKLDQLVEVHITKDEAVRVTGPQGQYWSIVRALDYEAINGEFEYSVNVGASTPRLPQLERAQWTAFMTQVIIPMPHVLTAPHFMKKMAEMYGIDDDAMLEELRQLGLKMLSGQMPMPGQTGSQAGQSEMNPAAIIGGLANGVLGGNANGGGAPGGMMTQAGQ
jgi:hypothetical protein